MCFAIKPLQFLATKEQYYCCFLNETDTGISKIQDQIKNFLESNNITTASDPSKSLSMYEVADRAFDTMQSTIARQKIAAYPPDIEIEIARNACGTLEFDKASEMIALGFQKAQNTYENLEDVNF